MPSSTLDIPRWVPPEPTKTSDIDWAPLWTLDLSEIRGENFTEVSESLVARVGEAFHKDGFIYAVNHGLSWDEVLRQFAIGQYAFNAVTEEEKQKFKADILRTGSFAGYKEMGHWKINGVKDKIEQFNVVSTSFSKEKREASFPPGLKALIPEIQTFAKFNHENIYRKVLTLLSLVLKLPADYLWNLSRDPESKGLDLLRYAAYHTPSKEDDQALGGVRLQGHTDFNAVSILWSQPITSLEVLMPSNEWKLVKHIDNALVINLGDCLQFLSGGYLKQTIHRVIAPPEDQAHYTRLGIFYFAFTNADVPLEPLLESPVVRQALSERAEGPDFWAENRKTGERIPTAGEWESLRVRAYGQQGTKKREDGHETEKIGGVEVTLYNDVQKLKKDELVQLAQQLQSKALVAGA
ncbi:Clavaminate synthase-like protein [Tilletiaria anomala UBC 951]|uniref:Clavaminate synthase-like protein n=1 Tax=Tilletiaria anomala (strain ATCC 24038 / CBS 436.72 / UBC 951) TaxID=1037660 RepID=A0A066WH44_TILAU|nr:Clavaminate synthase-like protein [Tilletiaria anomala UBC 951]KDN53151.1 Clavaminate synthase-like protein [Tilletiaria anomala UBC 951]